MHLPARLPGGLTLVRVRRQLWSSCQKRAGMLRERTRVAPKLRGRVHCFPGAYRTLTVGPHWSVRKIYLMATLKEQESELL